MSKKVTPKIEIPKKTEQINETVQTEFRFNPEAQRYILNTFPLSAEEELTAITDLIAGEPDWVHTSLQSKLRWIADEIITQTLLAYSVKEVGVTDEENLLTSVDYDGPDIIIVVGQFIEDIKENKQKRKSKKQNTKDNKVVDLNEYRRARS